MKLSATLHNMQQGYSTIDAMWKQVKPWLAAGHKLQIEIKQETRNSAQNARLWAMLSDISGQVEWYGRKLTPENWKHIFTAALKKQDVVPGIDGGFVVLGQSTSKMTKAQFSELMELISAFGAERGVRFTAPEYAEAE